MTQMQGGPKTILVVDDDESVRLYVSEVLLSAGYFVVSAADAWTALSVAHGLGEGLDLVITDVVMPNKDGIELADELENLFPNLSVLFITAFAPKQGENDTGTLMKPFTPEQLIERVERILKHGYAI